MTQMKILANCHNIELLTNDSRNATPPIIKADNVAGIMLVNIFLMLNL